MTGDCILKIVHFVRSETVIPNTAQHLDFPVVHTEYQD